MEKKDQSQLDAVGLNVSPEETGRLTMLDESGHRKHIIPAEVKGYFANHRQWSQWVLLLVFLLLPWTKINGVQSLWLDVGSRRFAIFGLTFWAHDAPLLWFILIFLVFGLAFATAVWGRVWCGWACPQTVFIEAVYRRIEKWVEGDYIARRKLASQPWNTKKVYLFTLKWTAFVVVSSVFAHSFVAYFAGAENLIQMVQNNPATNWTYFLVVSVTTLILVLDFGWFREQFCIVACPYGRFQSVLMDRDSLAVLYDSSRGEPRRGAVPPNGKQGDCVSCNRCVQVCPTGIDIRRGLQMECIACTACIDACDEIMVKVKKPTGLIKYDSVNHIRHRGLQPRAAIYLTIASIGVIGLTYNVMTREPVMAIFLRGADMPYSVAKDEAKGAIVVNHLKLHMQNQSFLPGEFQVIVPKDWAEKGIELAMAQNPVHLEGGQVYTQHFFVKFPAALTETTGNFISHLKITNTIESTKDQVVDRKVTFVGPLKGQ